MATETAVTAPPRRKLKPARKQVEVDEIDRSEKVQPGKEYNFWYNKWAGGDKEDALANKTLSQSRCVITRDAGYTRADASGEKFTCLFFARGCCPYGHECNFLHRLPDQSKLTDYSRDCFGREKHAEYRDDMGGVGSFNRTNRTIYVAKMQESPDKKQTQETMLRHFGEWGKIVKWNILYNRGIGFVTYETEAQASFAKEAMANQSMDMDEILNVRWAIEDPNPGEKRREEQRVQEEGQKAISGMMDEGLIEATQTLRALEDGDEEDFYPIEASRPEEAEEEERPQKRIRSGEDGPKSKGNGLSAASNNNGLLGGQALENLRYYAEQSRKQAEEERKRKVPAKTGMSLLGGYGSDEDSD